jgi:hypothetical protein
VVLPTRIPTARWRAICTIALRDMVMNERLNAVSGFSRTTPPELSEGGRRTLRVYEMAAAVQMVRVLGEIRPASGVRKPGEDRTTDTNARLKEGVMYRSKRMKRILRAQYRLVWTRNWTAELR